LSDYSNPLLIRLGNPALKQEFTNEISLRYKDFKAGKNRSIFWQLQFNNTAHKIVNATHINSQGAQEQQSVNLEGNYTIGTNIEYSISFGKGPNRGYVGLNTGARYDNAVNLVNAEKNVRKTYNLRQTMRAEYYIGEKFGGSASARFNGDWSDYSVNARKITALFWHNYNVYLNYELPLQFSLSSEINFVINEAQQNLAGTQAAVWNASIVKRLFKNQAGEIKLSAFDILNKSNNFSQYTGDNYIETAKTEVLKRVFVLSFRYNFRINKL
jgi:hypothetical protein